MKTFLKIPRWTHASVWVITILMTLGFEFGLLPSMCFQPDAEQEYALHVLAVVLTLLGSYVAMRLMAFAGVKQSVRKQEEEPAQCTYATLCLVRSALVALPVWYNLFVYYMADFTSTMLYCFLITAVASLFCWPSQETYENMRAPETPKSENQA